MKQDWFLVTKYNKDDNTTEWALTDINKAMSIYSYGDVKVSPRGSIYIGNITVQRKGGDGGRDTANMLQFKIKPCLIFNYVK
ncbi:MAG TPA: hypothetical protein VJY42_01980 [Candidatus Methanomethylophilaceae archaeon]|nr:hypothetical protein [Candidatus Methanomethylophilaceae archaeon]